MKTTVIQVESFDSNQSIRDKMERSDSGRILLIWPKRGKLRIQKTDLQILQRKAEELGAQLAIVCRNTDVIEKAHYLGISTFSSVPLAESGRWNRQKRSNTFQPSSYFIKKLQIDQNYKKKNPSSGVANKAIHIIAVILGVGAILSLLVFIVPTAKVTLSPVTTIKNIPITIWASPKVSSINLNGNLPAYEKTIRVSGEVEAQSTGTTGLATAYATGEVLFTNLTGADITVPAGTIISTDGESPIRFKTEIEANVAINSLEPVFVAVKALEPGAKGNVLQETLVNLEGSLGGLLTVTNPETAGGGEDTSALSPSEEDYARLKEKLLKQLRDEVQSQLSQQDGLELIDGTVNTGTVISETRSVEAGQPADHFTLSLDVEFTGLTYSSQELEQLANKVMVASLTSDEQVYSPKVVITLQDGTKSSLQDGMKWTVIVSCPVGPKIESDKLAVLISGKNIQDAKKILLSEIPLISEPTIDTFLSPIILPFAAFRIHFEVQ